MAGPPPESLVELLHLLNSANLTVPDELTKNLLSRSGAACNDDRTVRLVSLAAQKFLTDIVDEAKVAQSSRSQASLAVQKAEGYVRPQDKEKDKRAALLTEDLSKALQQYGLNLQRTPYHLDRQK